MKRLETQGEAENIVWYTEMKNKEAKRGTEIISNTNHFQIPCRIHKREHTNNPMDTHRHYEYLHRSKLIPCK